MSKFGDESGDFFNTQVIYFIQWTHVLQPHLMKFENARWIVNITRFSWNSIVGWVAIIVLLLLNSWVAGELQTDISRFQVFTGVGVTKVPSVNFSVKGFFIWNTYQVLWITVIFDGCDVTPVNYERDIQEVTSVLTTIKFEDINRVEELVHWTPALIG